ncbi:50S ribosomal protein L29 [Candidatus Woesearchaeota archaeon]|nr:50S ribosomal protein L29 [Candidatus Woesearchaeota archaeon]MBW3013753.1 50S ribosomal protein L29 [Candidatus Woesearchaeota archaeon]
MKFREIAQLGQEDLKNKEAELKKELMKLYAKVATGTSPENSGRIKQIKRILARIKTTKKTKK